MPENWTIEIAQLPILGSTASHTFWILKDAGGNTVRELQGLVTGADNNANTMGLPFDSTDTIVVYDIGFSDLFPGGDLYDSTNGVFNGNFMTVWGGVTTELAFTGTEAEVMAKWGAVGPIATIINQLEYGYSPVVVGDWGTYNSNTIARLVGQLMGLDNEPPSLDSGSSANPVGWDRDLVGALIESIVYSIGLMETELERPLTEGELEYYTDLIERLVESDSCFLPATPITMSDGGTKRIDQIVAGDMVMSYDKDGDLTAGRVKRTMVNTVKYVLDMFGTGVTPGHVYLCGDGKFDGQHVPLIDILRSDGAIIREDGTKVRAATGCDLGSAEDALIWAITGTRGPDGIVVEDSAQIRLSTRIITDEGNDISIAEIIKSLGGIVEDGLIKPTPNSDGIPFHWQFSGTLPRPEDYILKRSDLTLNEIYAAAEWEDVQPKLQAPLAGEAGGSFINVPDDATPPNVPLSFAGTSLEPSMTRKQRRAFQAKARKSSPRVSN